MSSSVKIPANIFKTLAGERKLIRVFVIVHDTKGVTARYVGSRMSESNTRESIARIKREIFNSIGNYFDMYPSSRTSA